MHELSIALNRTSPDGVRVYEISGMLGIEGSTDIQKLFETCLGEGVYNSVFILDKLEFISSAGVGAFISVAKEIRASDGDIVFAVIPPRIRRVLESLDLLDYFKIYDSVDEALNHFSRLTPTTSEVPSAPSPIEVPLRSLATPKDVLEFSDVLVRLRSTDQPIALALSAAVHAFGIPWMALFTQTGDGFFAPLVVAGQGTGIGPGFRLPVDGAFVDHLRGAKNDFILFPRWRRAFPPSEELETLQMTGTQGIFRLRSGEGLHAFICLGPSPIIEGEVEALSLLGRQLNWFVLYHLSIEPLVGELAATSERLTRSDEALTLAGKKLNRKTLELKTMFQAARDFSTQLAVHELLNTFLVIVIGQLGVSRTAVFLMEGDHLNLKMAKGITNELDLTYSQVLSEDFRRELLEAKRPLPLEALTEGGAGSLTQKLTELGLTMVCGLVSTREFLGVLALGPRVGQTDYDAEELRLIWSLSKQVSVHLENARLFQRLHKHDRDTVGRLIAAIDSRDPYTRGHSERVSRYVAQLAQMAGLPRQEIHQIVYGAILHDVGMIATLADATIQDTVQLSEEEQRQVEAHPEVGADILKLLGFDEECIKTVRQHHERWDGKGYSLGLTGEEAYVGARLVAVADSYDTMISGRRYQQPKTARSALAELEAEAGSRYDPKVVALFVRLIASKDGDEA
ncbi:MAG: HD domain-containing protein [bacterium]|nr:HD domain-containing protein [bacterium]